MKSNILVRVTGKHYEAGGMHDDEGPQPIETLIPGTYYYKNGKHYILSEEPVEGSGQVIKNMIKITPEPILEITKTGPARTSMVFEPGRIHLTEYHTPFGRMRLAIRTRSLILDIREGRIQAEIFYALDVEGEPLSECEIQIEVTEL